MAERAGVLVPGVLAAGRRFGPSGDAALVTRVPDGLPLSEADAGNLTDDTLDGIMRAALRMRAAGLAHGALGGDTIIVSDRGICVRDFRRASASAPVSRLDGDLAAALGAMGAGAIASTAWWIVKGLLFIIAIPFAAGSFHAPSGSSGNQKIVWIVLAVVLAVGVAAALIALVPRLGRLASSKVRPHLVNIWANVKAIATEPASRRIRPSRRCLSSVSSLPTSPVWGWFTLAWMRRREYI